MEICGTTMVRRYTNNALSSQPNRHKVRRLRGKVRSERMGLRSIFISVRARPPKMTTSAPPLILRPVIIWLVTQSAKLLITTPRSNDFTVGNGSKKRLFMQMEETFFMLLRQRFV